MDVLSGISHASARDALVWAPASFIAGSIAHALFRPCWDIILESHPRADMLHRWLDEGVRPSSYWQRFQGSFEGAVYDSPTPPRARFPNHPSAVADTAVGPLDKRQSSAAFVRDQLVKNLQSGAIIRWQDHPLYDPIHAPTPHLVLPLGVEPEKPRLIWDGRFLNLWQRHVPFTMEGLASVPNLVLDRGFMWTLDHHSGFHHVPIALDEQTYFGFADAEGTLYVCTVMNFGWRHAPLIYNTFTHASLSLLREAGLRNLYYTDDIFGTSHRGTTDYELWTSANDSAYLHAFVMTALGYFLSPKSVPFPAVTCVFLGLTCDTISRRFTIPHSKLWKFMSLLQSVFNTGSVTIRDLERIAGRAVHFALAIPGAMFFVRHMYRTLADATRGRRRPGRHLPLTDELRHDLTAWLDLPAWAADCSSSTWPQNHHNHITIYSDASSGTDGRGAIAPDGVTVLGREPVWGGTLHLPGQPPLQASGFFPTEHRHRHINELEALARYYVLRAFSGYLRNARVTSSIDNTVARRYFNRDGGPNPFMTQVALDTFQLQRENNMYLDRVAYVASADNPADLPSRQYDTGDYRLHPALFAYLWSHPQFGARYGNRGFTMDWMASHRNAQRHPVTGDRLPFYSRYHDVGAAGVDMFAQDLRSYGPILCNGYINPPWVLLPAVLAYLRESHAVGTIIVPELVPLPLWWPIVMDPAFCRHAVRVTQRDTRDVFLHPSSDYRRSIGPCPFAVWAVAFDCRPYSAASTAMAA